MAVNKIQGETPFKIVGTNFMISASNEDYTLAFSPTADGEYTPLPISCPAGENNAVIGCPQAGYWKLIGNNSIVLINS